MARGVPLSPVEYIEDEHGCWVWQRKTWAGYGRKVVKGVQMAAHRVYYEAEFGPVPAGLELDHLCRNRACVNPAHLEAVTRAVNIQRGAATKLTWDSVREIRGSGASSRALAGKYQVTAATINMIRRGATWKDGESLAA